LTGRIEIDIIALVFRGKLYFRNNGGVRYWKELISPNVLKENGTTGLEKGQELSLEE